MRHSVSDIRRIGDHELWIENKSAVPRHSSAASYFRGEMVPPRPQKVDLRNRLGDLLRIDGDTAHRL